MEFQRLKECFVPHCPNNSKNSPHKVFVRLPDVLKPAWCRMVNAVCYKVYLMYCCEDHLNLKEDLKNYEKWRQMRAEPMLKPTATLRNVFSEKPQTCAEQQSHNVTKSDSEQSSELMNLLLNPMENLTKKCNKKRRFEEKENIIPSSSASTLPVKVDAASQCHVKMVDKSTNYKARSFFPNTKNLMPKELDLSPSTKPSSSSPSMFGCTTDTETTSIGEADQGPSKKQYEVRTQTLDLIHKKPKMYLGLPLKFLWLINYIISKSTIKTTYLCLVLTLFKIKLNDSIERMSDDFEIPRTRISAMFAEGVEVLANFFQNLIFMPSALLIQKNLPLVFKIRYSNVQMIIDCFEIQIEKPADPVKQAQTWSSYKNCNTIKYLVGSTPNGFINFISAGYGGRISDKALVVKSQLLDSLPHNAVVLADRGFKEVESLLIAKGVKLLRPPSVYTGQKPTKEEVIQSKTIASLRVHIERVIRRIREFRLLKPHSVVNSKHVVYLDEIVIIACGLINLQSEIIKKF